MRNLGLTVLLFLSFLRPAFTAAGDDLFQAIRNNDLDALKHNLTRDNVNARDRRGATPLMQAAAFGSIEAMKILLDAGADVNAANDFNATALLWSARDGNRARLLIEHGADVNAQSKQGRTPLMLASMRDGGSDTVALLLEKGADVKLKDSRDQTALGLASEVGDISIMRLLAAKGADIDSRNHEGETPLFKAATSLRVDAVRLLLEHHASVNVANTSYPSVRNGQITLLKLTPLHQAATFGPLETVHSMLQAGAEVNVPDSRGLAALTFAVASDHANPGIVRALIDAGANVNARDQSGETPLDWARKFGTPEIITLLQRAGAKQGVAYRPPAKPDTERPSAASAVNRGVALLQRTSSEFFKQSGCVGCHHQPLAAQAQQAAMAAGIRSNEALAREQLQQLKSQWASSQEEFLQSLNPGGGPNRLGENLLGLYAAGYAPDALTDSAIVDLAESQRADGMFPSNDGSAGGQRPPITEGLIGSTARAVRLLRVYSIPGRKAEFEARLARAKVWLEHVQASCADDYAMRLLGLAWSGSDARVMRESASALLKLQRADGGWSANPHLTSDSYSTGKALYALAESGSAPVTDAAYRRGVEYLLTTQYPDGSWYVRSRAIKFQPYFQSGFPFGHDQWISAAGTAWAVTALARALEAK